MILTFIIVAIKALILYTIKLLQFVSEKKMFQNCFNISERLHLPLKSIVFDDISDNLNCKPTKDYFKINFLIHFIFFTASLLNLLYLCNRPLTAFR